MSGYAVAQIDEIDEISDGRCPWRPVRFHLVSRPSASMRLQLIRWAIGSSTSTTSHRSMTCRRSCTSSSEGARRSSSTASGWTHPRAHSSSFAPPLSGQRSLRSRGRRSSRSAELRGRRTRPQGGEIWMPLHHLYESGEYAEAADQGRELIEAHPEYAGPLYNLACCESLAGRTDDAIKHLRLAIDRHEPFRSLAAEDSDFDPIRDEAAFKELVQGKQPSQPLGNRLAPVASGTFPNAGPGDASEQEGGRWQDLLRNESNRGSRGAVC